MTNKIFFLQGASGCGKSTFVEDNDLNRFVVSTDDLRTKASGGNYVYDEKLNDMVFKMDFSGPTSSAAFKIASTIVAARAYRGETIVFDSVAANRKTIGNILSIVKGFNYEVFFVDMQDGLTVEEAIKRNNSRSSYKFVPEDVIRKQWDNCNNFLVEKGEKKISKDDMLEMQFSNVALNLEDDYRFIRVIGDVQGCWNALEKSGVTELRKDTLYIFVGDLLDRGPENDKVFNWAVKNMNQENVIFVKGNHDEYFRQFDSGSSLYRDLPRNTRKTLDQIVEDYKARYKNRKLIRRDALKLHSNLKDFFAFTVNGKKFFVTHGGISPRDIKDAWSGNRVELGLESSQYFYYGMGMTSGTSDYKIDIDNVIHKLNEKFDVDVVQFHGHRNEYHVGAYAFDDVFNLENRVERDGSMRVATIRDDGSVTVDEYSEN